MPSDDAIAESLDLWKAIAERAGLQEQSYDREVVQDVKAALGLAETDDLETALVRDQIPVDLLLRAILKAVRPFSQMLSDLLTLYQWIGATSSDDPNLRIRYEFGTEVEKAFDFDLNAFREQRERWVSATRQGLDFDAEAGPFWAMSQVLSAAVSGGSEGEFSKSLHSMYRDGGSWPQTWAPESAGAVTDLEPLLEEVSSVAEEVLARSRSLAPGPASLIDVGRDEERAGQPTSQRVLLELHKDHWLALVADSTARIAQRSWPDSSELDLFVRDLGQAVARLPRIEVHEERRIDELLDVLSLPTWRRRYELYSAWLVTLIVEALGREVCTFYVVDGVLSFSFAGSHLASVETGLGRLELWAELRHPYATPIGKGRSRAIQPDYTLTKPPFADSASAVLVVEAKQYARTSLKNFRHALVDYTGGHTSATVLLANYGPMSPSLLSAPPERSSAFGHVRPDMPRERKAFLERLRAVAPPPTPTPISASKQEWEAGTVDLAPVEAGPVQTIVMLQWSSGKDLDLHLYGIASRTTTDFRSVTPADASRVVRLWNDDRSAPGLEVAHVLDGAGAVAVWVHRFCGDESLSEMGAVVHIHGSDPSRIIVRASKELTDAEWWEVGVLDANGGWEQVDRAASHGPER